MHLKNLEKQKNSSEQNIFMLLIGLFVAIIISTNLITGKYFKIGKVFMTCGVITYPFTYLLTDITSEVFGEKKANLLVLIGFIVSIMMCFMTYIANILPIHGFSPTSQKNFTMVFGLTPGIVIGSMVAYLISQFADVFLFHKIKKLTKGKHLWLRNNIATILSEFIDTITFAITTWLIWFLFLDTNYEISFKTWIIITGYEYLAKCIFAIFDTPILYFCVYRLRKRFNKNEK